MSYKYKIEKGHTRTEMSETYYWADIILPSLFYKDIYN